MSQLTDGVDGGADHLGALARLHLGAARGIGRVLRVARHLVHRRAHLGGGGADLIDRRVLAADQPVVGRRHAGQRLGRVGHLAGDPADLADQRLQLVEEAVEGIAELAQLVPRQHFQAHTQVAIALGDLLDAMKQVVQRAGHQHREAQHQHHAEQQADGDHHALLPAAPVAQFDGGGALGVGRAVLQLAELIDGGTRRLEVRLAVAVAERRGRRRITGGKLDHPAGSGLPLGEATVEVGHQPGRLRPRLHLRVLVDAIVGLLQVLRMRGLQRVGILPRRLVEQAAFGDEGLVEVTVGVEQQADGGQVAVGQAGAGVGHLADALHAQPAHHQQ